MRGLAVKRHLPFVPRRLQDRVLRGVTAVFGDVLGQFLEDDADVSIKGSAYPARIVRVERETARTVTLQLELEQGYRLHYKAGQSVCISFAIGPVLWRRHYALSSAPEENRVAITVQKIFQGRVSSWVLDRTITGQRVYLEDPHGDFVLPADNPQDQRYILLAAGAGIAPIRSLVVDLLGKNPQANITLVYCTRTDNDVVFRRELEAWEHRHPGFRLHLHQSRRDGYSNDLSRRLSGEQFLSLVGDVAGANIYLCAPAGLTKVVTDALSAIGVPESSVHIQLFSAQAHVTEMAELKPRTIVFEAQGLLASRYSLQQQHVTTLSEAAREAHVRIDQACTSGSCKACRVRLLHGSVVMDEPNTLSVDEARSGYVLACVAYPCEDVVVELPR